MLKRALIVTTMLAAGGGTGVTAHAADPNLVGTWKSVDDFVASGHGRPLASWGMHQNKDGVWTPKPEYVVDHQDGRLVSGYILTPTGKHQPFHAILKHNGTELLGRNEGGIITADVDGDRMEWCWASTAPGLDYTACNTLQRQNGK
jgi:hypothetical protein